jgi:hypothetical protein
VGKIILEVTSFDVAKCELRGKLGENDVVIALPQREFDWFIHEADQKTELTDDNHFGNAQKVELTNVEITLGKSMWHVRANAIELV